MQSVPEISLSPLPTSQQSLASKIGPLARAVPHRKLAHWQELYLIPTGDIAAVVFATKFFSQLRNRGIDLDRVSQVRARQDGKTLDKTSNTKYAAQIIAEHIQGWLPLRSTDPGSQHQITQLRSQLAEFFGDEPSNLSTHLVWVNKAPLLKPQPSNVL